MRGSTLNCPGSVIAGSRSAFTGTSPEVMRPTPPFARAAKYATIFAPGRPVSSAMHTLPIGPITMRFLSFRRFTWMGLKSAV